MPSILLGKYTKSDFFGFGLNTWAKLSLSFKLDWVLISNGQAMLDLADAGHFAQRCIEKWIFCIGLDTWANMSLSLKFGWILISNGWAILDMADAVHFAWKMHR